LGADNTIVFSGALSLSSSFTGPPGGPKNFDIIINLTTPFLYNPAAGNLLMDVRNFNAGTTTQFDATGSTTGDAVSRIFTSGSGVNSPTADFSDSNGLVTQFTFAAVPEPGTLALVGATGVAMLGYYWRRRQQAKAEMS
jgi:hypothetical protein